MTFKHVYFYLVIKVNTFNINVRYTVQFKCFETNKQTNKNNNLQEATNNFTTNVKNV